MKESDEYRLGRSAALRGESMAKYQSLTARMNPKREQPSCRATSMGKNKRNSHQRNQSELAT